MGTPWVIAGIAAAATTLALDTGEVRQLIDRVGHEFFDDVLGMRPATARKWSSAGLHIAGTMILNAGLNAIVYPNSSTTTNGLDKATKQQMEKVADSGDSMQVQDIAIAESGIEGIEESAEILIENSKGDCFQLCRAGSGDYPEGGFVSEWRSTPFGPKINFEALTVKPVFRVKAIYNINGGVTLFLQKGVRITVQLPVYGEKSMVIPYGAWMNVTDTKYPWYNPKRKEVTV